MGAQRTFLEKESPFLTRHHSNWRNRAIQKSESYLDEEMLFTCPMSLSKKDFEKIREMLTGVIEKSSTIIKDSPAEDIACLNIDLFWIGQKD